MTNKGNMVQSFSLFFLLLVCVSSVAVVVCVAVVYDGVDDDDIVQPLCWPFFSSFVALHLLFVDTKPEVPCRV